MTNQTIEQAVEEFNELHTISITLQSGMMIGNTTEKAYLDSYERLEKHFRQALQAQRDAGAREAITEDTSDGYHTFKDLYEFRKIYNATLFNEWHEQGKYYVHKSTKHSDGEDCFGGGWFIVVATLPTGDISNHYEMKDWDLFVCETREVAKKWDGHSSLDVLQRLQALTPPTNKDNV